MDEQQRGRIRDDLKGFFKGRLWFDDLSRALYSTDASIFEIQPLGVAIPADEADVSLLVRYCYEHRIPLVPRGAGTGLAGESLGAGLVLDMSKGFQRITDIAGDTVRVQPGVRLEALNRRLAAVGRRFAPDPASRAVCTIGGMIANNASGSHVLKHGYTVDHVAGLRTVLDNGDVAALSQQPWPLRDDLASDHLHDILQTLGLFLEANQNTILSYRRPPYDRCGYQLDGVMRSGWLDLMPLLVGSEGTLGIFTEATLKTALLPGGQALVLLGFGKLDRALGRVGSILETGPAACDLIDRRLLSLVRSGDGVDVPHLIPASVEAVLLVEYETDRPDEARRRASRLIEGMTRGEDPPAIWHARADSPDHHQRYWKLRDFALPSLYGHKGGAQPAPFAEDVAVPIDRMAELLHKIQDVLKEHDTTASFLIHAGSGQIHTRPFLDLHSPGDASKVFPIAEKIHTLAIDMGGTVSTQHAVGLARTPWVARQVGPLYPLMRQVKAIFDPRGIFNPGKIVDPSANQALWPLRKPARKNLNDAELRWQPLQVLTETNHCNGCGHCRTQTPGTRMCPIFRATDEEPASPRSKMNLLRHLLTEEADPKLLASAEVRALADLCVQCKMCASECPARVNVPKLMLEIKANNVTQHGLDAGHWFLTRLEKWAQWGSSFNFLANRMLRSHTMRWLMSRIFGLSAKRRLPPLATQPFLSLAQRRGWTRPPRSTRPRVTLFVDLFANYFDPQIALAAALVLEHHGYEVHVPPNQQSSGLERLTHGDADGARHSARRNLRAFVESARIGVPVVCLEPSSALMLRQDYLDLLDDLDARLVAERTVEFTAFLAELLRQGKFRTDFQRLDMTIGHHVPCHLKALHGDAAGPRLLGMIPGMRVKTLDVSCSGMAGTFGLQRASYELSLKAGAPLLHALREPSIQYGSTECGSCRMQMEDGARRRTLHPAQYLAWAYGKLPEVAQRLAEPIKDLVLR